MEIMKKKFGDTVLHETEVILEDLKRSIKFTNESLTKTLVTNIVIISPLFWPNISKSSITLPKYLLNAQQELVKIYEEQTCSNFKLNWYSLYGLVDIELEINNKTVILLVTVIEASIIDIFQSKEEWNLHDMATTLNISPYFIRKHLDFWISYKLIREASNDFYVLTEDKCSGMRVERSNIEWLLDDQEVEYSIKQSEDVKKEKYLKLCWQYVSSMLKGARSIAPTKVSFLLKHHATSITRELLERDIQQMLEEHLATGELLINTDGLYELRKE
ncbi:hypothetical protein GJ496_010048 [Pomphorhynchus laevis]|nr:hypothetical protein GJ496_010048 [Pomphorhynchus laevis]